MTLFHSDGISVSERMLFKLKSRPFWVTRQKKNSTTTYRGREKCTTTLNGSLTRMPSTGSTWPGHKRKDCSFGRQGLKVPADCIEKVVSQGGDKTLFQRPSTPRPAPKIVLKNVWKLRRQQQQQQDTLRSTGKPVAEQKQSTQRSTRKPVAKEEKPFKGSAGRSRKNDPNSRTGGQVANQENSAGSAKNQNVQFENWGKKNCLSWERFPRPFKVKRA